MQFARPLGTRSAPRKNPVPALQRCATRAWVADSALEPSGRTPTAGVDFAGADLVPKGVRGSAGGPSRRGITVPGRASVASRRGRAPRNRLRPAHPHESLRSGELGHRSAYCGATSRQRTILGLAVPGMASSATMSQEPVRTSSPLPSSARLPATLRSWAWGSRSRLRRPPCPMRPFAFPRRCHR